MSTDPDARRQALIEQLNTRPVRNIHAIAEPVADGGELRVRVPLQYPAALRAIRRVLQLRDHMTYGLDPMSRSLWERIDGECTVGELIDELAAQHRLTFFEARGLIAQFLGQLCKKGLVVLVVPNPPAGDEPS